MHQIHAILKIKLTLTDIFPRSSVPAKRSLRPNPTETLSRTVADSLALYYYYYYYY